MFTWLALAIAGIATAAITAGVSAYENHQNRQAQEEANQKNIEMQQQVNEQNQYNIEHAHQIEMKDLEAAGLNPVLTATGGNGAPISQLQAPSVNPVKTDLSGVVSGINSAMHNMTMLMMAKSMAQTNAALLEKREAGNNARLAANIAARREINERNISARKTTHMLAEEGKNARLAQILAAKTAKTHYHNTPSTKASSKVVKKALKALSNDELNWDFVDESEYVYDPKQFGYH